MEYFLMVVSEDKKETFIVLILVVMEYSLTYPTTLQQWSWTAS